VWVSSGYEKQTCGRRIASGVAVRPNPAVVGLAHLVALPRNVVHIMHIGPQQLPVEPRVLQADLACTTRTGVSAAPVRAAECDHATGRERMVSPTVQPLQEPFLRTLWFQFGFSVGCSLELPSG
jgi:hypothetical protein